MDIINETTAGSIAGVTSALGAGDPNASIYPPTKRKKKSKTKIIRRIESEKENDS